MDEEKLQRENPLLYLFFIISGVLFVAISFSIRAQNIEDSWAGITVDVLLNVGASLIATVGVAYMYQRFGTNRLAFYLDRLLNSFSITQKAADWGIKDIWRERRHIPNDMWNTFTEAANSDVWLMGMAELGFAEDPKFRAIVSSGAARGCNYRFLLLDPDAEIVREVDEKEGGTGQLQGRIRLSVQKFSEMQNENKKKKGKVELRLHANTPQVSIVRADDDILVTPYMYYRPGNSSLTFLIHQTTDGVFGQYTKFFNDMWERAYPPKTSAG